MPLRREDGQIFPLMAGLLLSVLALGFGLFQVARAGVLRSEAQTAADAAALAGARNAKQQLEAMMAAGGYADPALIQDPLVRAAVELYARKNGARVVSYYRQGVDVKVRVKTAAQLGDDAERVDSEDVKGSAKARARIDIEFSSGLGGGGGLLSGGGGGGGSGSGDKKVTDSEWDKFKKTELDGKKPTCTDGGPGNDVIKLGEFLQSQGFDIGENAAFSGPGSAASVGRSTTSQHYACSNAGALDINAGAGQSPAEMAAIDPLITQLQALGYATIWRAAGHFDHLHVDAGSASIGPGAGGGFGYGDQVMQVRLIDWDAEYADFNLFPADGTVTARAGNPDPAVMKIMCGVLNDRNATERVRLATFETAIVESGVRNLNYGDRDSVGVFQQREAGWGTFEQRTNVAYATNSFLKKAIEYDKSWSGTTGALAQKVQVSAFPERYDQVRGQAASLHNQYCGDPKISPNS